MPDKFYAQVLTPGVWLVLSNVAVRHRPSLQVLSNHGQDYDYRIADSQALLCAQDLTVEPSTDSWTTAQPLPTARHGLSAVAIGNRIYVLAEDPTPGGSQSALNEVFMVLADRP